MRNTFDGQGDRLDDLHLVLKPRTAVPLWVKVPLILIAAYTVFAVTAVLLWPGSWFWFVPIPSALATVPLLGILALTGRSSVILDSNERYMRFTDAGGESDFYWHSVAWAYVRADLDSRRDALDYATRRSWRKTPFRVMVQEDRPPYEPWVVFGNLKWLDAKDYSPETLAIVIDEVIKRAAPSAIDPTLCLLRGLLRRIIDRDALGDSSVVLLAAKRMDVTGVSSKAAVGDDDLILKALFSCLYGRTHSALEQARHALDGGIVSWDLLLCEAICLKRERPDDAAGLLAPVLGSPDFPADFRPSLEAAAEAGTSSWYDTGY